jgi:quercetin dioxygenase-like cupin family protein
MATFTLTPKESVTVREHAAELLEVEVTYAPGGDAPPAHFHPGQDESFELLTGSLCVRIDGAERSYRAGETFEIPRGSAHQMWNPGDEPVRAIWQTRPAGRTLDWFEGLDSLQRSGRVGKNGIPGPLAMGAYLTEYRDVFRLAARPQPLVRGALALLGVAGRVRGYRP